MRKNTSRSASGRGNEDTVKEKLEQLKHERYEKRHHGETPSAENEKIAEALANGGSFVGSSTDAVQDGNSTVGVQSGKSATDKQASVKRGSGRRSVQNARTKTSVVEKQQENRSDNQEEQKSMGKTGVSEESKLPSAVLRTHKNEVDISHENKNSEERKLSDAEKHGAEENKSRNVEAHEEVNNSGEKRTFFRDFDKNKAAESDNSTENNTELSAAKNGNSAENNASERSNVRMADENKRNKKSAENHSDGMDGGNHDNNTGKKAVHGQKNGNDGNSVKKDATDKSAHTKNEASEKKDIGNKSTDTTNVTERDSSHKKSHGDNNHAKGNGQGKDNSHVKENSRIEADGKNHIHKPVSENKSVENKTHMTDNEQSAHKSTVKSSENKENKAHSNQNKENKAENKPSTKAEVKETKSENRTESRTENKENKTEKASANRESKGEKLSSDKTKPVENKPVENKTTEGKPFVKGNKPTSQESRAVSEENKAVSQGSKPLSGEGKPAYKEVKTVNKENKSVNNENKVGNNTNKPASSRPQSDLEWTSSIVDRIFAEKEDETEEKPLQNAANKERNVKEKPVSGISVKKQQISRENKTAGSSDEKTADVKPQKREKAVSSKQTSEKVTEKSVVADEKQPDTAQPQNKTTPMGAISSLLDKVKERFAKKPTEKAVKSQENADNSVEKTDLKLTQGKTPVEKHHKTEKEIKRDEDLMRAISEAQKQREERLNKEGKSRVNAVAGTHKAQTENSVNENNAQSASQVITQQNTDNHENTVDIKKADLSADIVENKNSQAQNKSDAETTLPPEVNSNSVRKPVSSEKATQHFEKQEDYSTEKLFDSKVSYPRRIAMLEETRRDYNALKNCVMQFNGVKCVMFKECEAFFYDGKAVFFIDEKQGKLRFFVARDYAVRLGNAFTQIKENSVIPVGSMISVDDDRHLRSAENCIHTVMNRIGVTQNFEYNTVDYYTHLKQKGVTEFLPH